MLLFIFPHLNIKILSFFYYFNLIDESSDDSSTTAVNNNNNSNNTKWIKWTFRFNSVTFFSYEIHTYTRTR